MLMKASRISPTVSVDIYERDQQFYANAQVAEAVHSLGPAQCKEDLYQLIYGLLSDLPLIEESNPFPSD